MHPGMAPEVVRKPMEEEGCAASLKENHGIGSEKREESCRSYAGEVEG